LSHGSSVIYFSNIKHRLTLSGSVERERSQVGRKADGFLKSFMKLGRIHSIPAKGYKYSPRGCPAWNILVDRSARRDGQRRVRRYSTRGLHYLRRVTSSSGFRSRNRRRHCFLSRDRAREKESLRARTRCQRLRERERERRKNRRTRRRVSGDARRHVATPKIVREALREVGIRVGVGDGDGDGDESALSEASGRHVLVTENRSSQPLATLSCTHIAGFGERNRLSRHAVAVRSTPIVQGHHVRP